MEFVSGKITIVQILLDQQNWLRFYSKFKHKIRSAITDNITKVLACRTDLLGFHLFGCECGNHHKVAHSCKSRFCNACGKKQTDQWAKHNFNAIPKMKMQHITFTMPDVLWMLFWANRDLFAEIPKLSANIIKKDAAKSGAVPAIFLAIHTFGRDLKCNVHIHLSTSCGGLSLDCTKWINHYFHHQTLKSQWRYEIINLFRCAYKNGTLKMIPALGHIKNYTAFNSWLNMLYAKTWNVFLQKPTKVHKRNIEYLSRYIKRPPIAESRILAYDGQNVTFKFLDHKTNEVTEKTMNVFAFIAQLIRHIHDSGFRVIRYYGLLANRVRTKAVEAICKVLKITNNANITVKLTYQTLFISAFGYNPLICEKCKSMMMLVQHKLGLSKFKINEKQNALFRGEIQQS